jgi:hypothetical protein
MRNRARWLPRFRGARGDFGFLRFDFLTLAFDLSLLSCNGLFESVERGGNITLRGRCRLCAATQKNQRQCKQCTWSHCGVLV